MNDYNPPSPFDSPYDDPEQAMPFEEFTAPTTPPVSSTERLRIAAAAEEVEAEEEIEEEADEEPRMSDPEWERMNQAWRAYPDETALRPRWLVKAKTFDEVSEEDMTPPCYRIEDLAVCDGNTNLLALYKTGKTVMETNIARSLVDNVPFLGRYAIEPVDGNIGILNYEMIAAQFNYWLDQQNIINRKRLAVLHLRGEGAHIEDDDTLGWLAEWLNEFDIEVLLIDTLTSALKPDSNPNLATTAAMFTSRLDGLRLRSGLRDIFLASHTGHPTGTRSGIPLKRHTAGSQKFMAWGDANWDYSSDAKDQRWLSTSGRIEHHLPSTQVHFDETTKLLSLGTTKTSSGRPSRSVDEVTKDVTRLLREVRKTGDGWQSKNAIETGVPGSNDAIRMALEGLVEEGLVEVQDGSRGARLHRWIG